MGHFNRVTMVGSVTKKPELRTTRGPLVVCDFTMAVTEQIKGKDQTLFIDVTTFGNTAESCAAHLDRGRLILVEGRLVKEKWTHANSGDKRSRMKIMAGSVRFLNKGTDHEDTPIDAIEETV